MTEFSCKKYNFINHDAASRRTSEWQLARQTHSGGGGGGGAKNKERINLPKSRRDDIIVLLHVGHSSQQTGTRHTIHTHTHTHTHTYTRRSDLFLPINWKSDRFTTSSSWYCAIDRIIRYRSQSRLESQHFTKYKTVEMKFSRSVGTFLNGFYLNDPSSNQFSHMKSELYKFVIL